MRDALCDMDDADLDVGDAIKYESHQTELAVRVRLAHDVSVVSVSTMNTNTCEKLLPTRACHVTQPVAVSKRRFSKRAAETHPFGH